MPNVSLAAQIRDVITSQPSRHYQGMWYRGAFGRLTAAPVERLRSFAFTPVPEAASAPDGFCGTTACVAGWAAIFAAPDGTVLTGDEFLLRMPDGREVSVDKFARKALDITPAEARYLFHAHRSREEVLEALDALAAGRPVPLPLPLPLDNDEEISA